MNSKPYIRILLTITIIVNCVFSINAQTISGELKKWHAITIEFTDDETYSETGSPNPFLDRRLNVTFVGPSGQTYLVPGYFAADGDAAETSATSGNKWHVKFSPDQVGNWTYTASFREGSNVAVTYPSNPNDGSVNSPIHGLAGSFSIGATDKTGRDFRSKGRLTYDGTRYPKFTETGEAFIKAGPDSPENFLAYLDFDDVFTYAAPDRRKSYAAHIPDWQSGDPQWQGSKGQGIIGAINYLSSVGMNSISFLTMNKFYGDTKDVTMHVDQSGQPLSSYLRYDISRLAQWDIVFAHAQTKGMFLHIKAQEQENAAQLGGNGGIAGNTERKLYFRELIARFGHHLALNWNMGEENEGNTAQSGLVNTSQRIAQLQYVKDIDPYQHLRVVHSGGSNSDQDAMYNPLLGSSSELTGISMQVLFQVNHERVKYWIDQSTAAGKPWPVSSDETGTGGEDNQANRENKLYGTYFAGGYGVEYYFQGEDFTIQDFRSGDKQGVWEKTKYALDFMNQIPYAEMQGDDSLISGSDNQCFYKSSDTYALYLPVGNDNPTLQISGTGDTYSVQWFDPRNGGSLQNGSISEITSNGGNINIGLPPNNGSLDWVALVQNISGGGNPSISINNFTVVEGNNAQLEVILNAAIAGGFQVNYDTSDGTAVAGEDYTSNSGVLNFEGVSGEIQTITLNTLEDSIVENSENFIVTLSNATNGVEINDDQGVVTISDNDTNAEVTINDISIMEGTNAVFTLTLNNDVTGGVAVDYSSADISAIAGQDYISDTSTVNFLGNAGETQTITISTIEDSLIESSEQFAINITTSTQNVAISDGQGLATILDNDEASIIIDDITLTEGNNASFTVSLDNAVSGGFTVDFTTADDSAIAPGDYTSNSGTLTFTGTAGESQTVSITTIDDTDVETNEQFFVNLSNATNGVTIADNQGIATLTDNDAAASVTIDDISITEGNNAIFTVSLDNTVSGGFTVDFTTADDSAVAPGDYTANSGTLTFTGTAGESQTVTITTIDDVAVEANEQFFVNLTNATNGVTIADNQGIATLTDNDAAASITISDITTEEGNDAVFTVSVDNAVSGGFSVDFTTADDSANAPGDYTSNSGTLTFTGTAGESQTVTITTIDDTDVEANEQFLVNLTNATNGVTIADNQGIATLTDNDADASVTIDDISITEGNNAIFTVSLDNTVSGGFTVDFTTTDDSAIAPGDYTSNSGTLTFTGTAGESQTVTITTIDDTDVEANEQFLVNLTNATNGVTIADNQGIAVIIDNEEETPEAPELSIQETSAEEGTIMVIPVSLNKAATELIELEIIFENITTTDTDFETNPVTLLFEVGQLSSDIRIPIFNDGENEEIETFRILVGTVIRGEILNPEVEGIASILDQPELIVYPVPLVDNQIPLSLTGMGNGTFFLLVTDSSGKTLISQVVEISENQLEIDLPSTLANGIYLLNLQNADTGTEYSKKFALNR